MIFIFNRKYIIMGKKIIISENIENLFIQLALNEAFYPEANKVLIIKKLFR